MNIIIRNNKDSDGLTEAIIKELKKRYKIGYCGVFDCNLRYPRQREEGVDYLDYGPLGDQTSLLLETTRPSHAVPRRVLNGLLPYKSMAMHMAYRESHYDIYEYRYLEDLYYKLIFYQYGFLMDKKIDFILFMVPPHHMGEYTLYSLAKVMEIKMLIMFPIIANGMYLPALSIETCGDNIYKEFKLIQQSMETPPLDEWFTQFYERVTKGTNFFSDKDQHRIQKLTWNTICNFLKPYYVLRRFAKFFALPIMKKYRGNLGWAYEEQMRLLKLTIKAFFHNLSMKNQKDYAKYAVKPDYNKKFIYFALQQTPEETTMPRAGEYRNQLLSLITLSKAAEELKNEDGIDVKIYVKEHWVQPHREKHFYSKILKLPQVELIDLKANSQDLVRNSIAVSSQIGTCLLEATLNLKNSFYFGEGMPYKGCPGTLFVDDTETVKNTVKSILRGEREISIDEGMKYLKAVENNFIPWYCDSLSDANTNYNKEDSAQKVVEVINKYCITPPPPITFANVFLQCRTQYEELQRCAA